MKYTSSDLDAMREFMGSAGHFLVKARLEGELERRRMELETGTGSPDNLRGQIKALRTALEIPSILQAEIKKAIGWGEKA